MNKSIREKLTRKETVIGSKNFLREIIELAVARDYSGINTVSRMGSEVTY